jgi:Flp pilus assembly protein TadD
LLGRVLLAQGDAESAIREFRQLQRPVPGGDGNLGRAYAAAGRREEARAEIERLQRRAAEGFGVAYDIAGIHAALGEVSQACMALQRSLDDQSQFIGFIGSDPAMDPLRNEACLAEVQRQLLGAMPRS